MSSIRPRTSGYNLRRRDNQRTSSPTIPGGFAAPLPSPPRAASPATTPLSSVSTSAARTAARVDRGTSPLRDDRTYSQVVARSGSPTQKTGTEKAAVSTTAGQETATAPDVRYPAVGRKPYQATVEEVTDEGSINPDDASDAEGGPWIQVKKGTTFGP